MNDHKRMGFLVAASSGVMLNPLNSSMIALALYHIQADFSLSFATASWLVTGFYLVSTVGQPLMGKLGDVFGRRRLFMAGLLLTGISALGGALASGFVLLLIMRLLQSVGTSPLFPSAVSTIRRKFRKGQGGAIAGISTVNSAMAALGPTIGGVLIAAFHWPAIFLVNLPIVLFSFLLSWRFFPADDGDDGSEKGHFADIDLPGAGLFSVAMLATVGFLLSGQSRWRFEWMALGLIAFVVFWQLEKRRARPFIDPKLFQTHPAVGLVLLQNLLMNVYFYIIFFGLPLYFQGKMHLSVELSGLLMLFCSMASVVSGPFCGHWTDRHGFAPPMLVGTVMMLLGAVAFLLFFTWDDLRIIAFMMAFVGIGYGLLNVALQVALLRVTPPEMMGTVTGLLQSSRYIGAIAASVALGMVVVGPMTAEGFHILAMLMMVAAALNLPVWRGLLTDAKG